MEFIKGFRNEDGSEFHEGDKITITTIQGEVFDDVMFSSASKGKLGFNVDGELTERVLDVKNIKEVEKL